MCNRRPCSESAANSATFLGPSVLISNAVSRDGLKFVMPAELMIRSIFSESARASRMSKPKFTLVTSPEITSTFEWTNSSSPSL